MVKDFAEDIREIRHAHTCSHRNLHDVILLTATENKATTIVLEYQEYYDRITENQNDLDHIWKIGNEMGMSDLWVEPEGFDKDAKYYRPLREEIQKYPLLEGINFNRVCESDMSAYIDMVENSTKQLTIS
jgi:hypothetical protein